MDLKEDQPSAAARHDSTEDAVESIAEQAADTSVDASEDTKMENVEASEEGDTAPMRGEEGFTSEIYKLELRNLNKFTSVSELKKILGRLGLKPVKVKKNPKWAYAYVTFAVCVPAWVENPLQPGDSNM
jgi:tRNA (uracil-5-)-methyltransferase